ncbi:hypothetical protein FJZ31_36180 [Candidatus Poribacteria bacterium]|nr:hypothetical protein [Candidatus Poribacteria bacterium]
MTEIDKEAEREWVREQIAKYAAVFPRYNKYAEVLENLLKQASKKYAPSATVQVRPKSIASFAEKILRKKAKRVRSGFQIIGNAS